MKSQTYSKSEAILQIREVPRHSKDRVTRSTMDWQGTIEFAKINVYQSHLDFLQTTVIYILVGHIAYQ